MEYEMEIEAKFRVDHEQIFQQLLVLSSIGPFQLDAEADAEDQHNVYFDTADRRLRAGQYGLRVRDLGGRRIATLKGAAQARDGMYERDEWEVEIGGDDRPSAWPPSEARDRALALLGGAEPLPILAIRTRRRHIIATRAGTRTAELSLDDGTIDAAGRTASFRELEIELLKEGTRADLDELAELLRARFELIPEDRSKLARGLALLDEGESMSG
jgi:inorganic triphosphatase YgiF